MGLGRVTEVSRTVVSRDVSAERDEGCKCRPGSKCGGCSEDGGGRDVIAILSRQHAQAWYLLKQLQALPSFADGGSAGQLSARKSIVDMLAIRVSDHEAIEEAHFWPLVREALPGGDRYAELGLRQRKEGRDALAELGELHPDSRRFDELADLLAAYLRRHVAFENKLFLAMRESLSAEILDRAGVALLCEMEDAPGRARNRRGRSGRHRNPRAEPDGSGGPSE